MTAIVVVWKSMAEVMCAWMCICCMKHACRKEEVWSAHNTAERRVADMFVISKSSLLHRVQHKEHCQYVSIAQHACTP